MVELDVQLTSDKEVVVFHDEKLSRCTDGGGRVSNWSLAGLKKLDGDYKVVELDDGNKVKGRVVILATGTEPRKLGVPGEAEFRGRGVTYVLLVMDTCSKIKMLL